MAENQEVTFALQDADKFDGPRAPQRRTLASKDGLVPAEILSVKYKGKSDAGNHVVTAMLATKSDDSGMDNVALWKHIPVTGENSQGLNIEQLYTLMSSAGTSKDKFAEISGKNVTAKVLNDALKGKIAYAQIRAEVYGTRAPRSEVVGFCSKKDYDKEVKAGNATTSHNYGEGAASALTGNGATGGATASAPPPPASGGDSDLTL